jgi:hypothetical protein
MPDSKRSFAESFLAMSAGHSRAAAIYGDLTEMAASRGSLWFAAAYLRTLFSLAWRPGFAFVGGLLSLNFLFCLFVNAFQIPQAPLARFLAYIVAGTGGIVWFALPFIAIRFGWKDRLTRLSFALFLSTLPGFSGGLSHFSIPLLQGAGIATLAILAAALISTSWRRAGLILVATIGAGLGSMVLLMKVVDTTYHLLGKLYLHQNSRSIRIIWVELAVSLALLIAATVCSRMRARPLRSMIEGAAHV